MLLFESAEPFVEELARRTRLMGFHALKGRRGIVENDVDECLQIRKTQSTRIGLIQLLQGDWYDDRYSLSFREARNPGLVEPRHKR